MRAETASLVDDVERKRVAGELGSTLFVEAGAGTGKTHALVERLTALVTVGGARLSGVAAITFTEAAAAELRARVRERLTRLAEEHPADRAVLAALGELDEAAITTIHGFAQRLLGEHLLEAGLPLRLRVLDEVEADLALEARFESFLDALFDEPAAHSLVTAARAVGIGLQELRLLARRVEESWHLHRLLGPPRSEDELARRVGGGFAAARAALALAVALGEHCSEPGDQLLSRLAALRGPLEASAERAGWVEQLRWLAALPTLRPGNLGRRDHWSCDVEDVRQAVRAYEEARSEALAEVHDLVLRGLLERLGEAAVAAAADRRASGEVVFHDLLVCCRDLLRDHPAARRAARRRWRQILVDEFQDTDALQYEILRLLGSAPGEESLEPGRLFFVGDPKQAIYRFRGADVALYEQARAELAGAGEGATTRLVASFRSVPGVLDFVNGCFSRLLADGGPAGYAALAPVRSSRGEGPAVRVLGGPLERAGSGARREQEASGLARALRQVVEEGWTVGEGSGRPARYGDIALLVPRRTGLGVLETALEEAGVPYRVASSTLLYASGEVRDLLACVRALVEPGDQRALLAALRTPAFACGDDDLLTYRQAGGAWRLDAPVPPGLEAHPVVTALACLEHLAGRRYVLGLVGTLEAVVRERRLLQLACGTHRRREAWRRIEFVLGQARAFLAAGGEDLAGFLRWADRQASAGVLAVEPPPAEEDADAVTVLTIHGAKGLEFPVVALAELGARPRSLSGPTLLRRPDGSPEARVRLGLATTGFAELAAEDGEAGRQEQLRLCYVAATRARDHLLVSLFHEPAATPAAATLAELVWAACQDLPSWQPFPSPRLLGPGPRQPAEPRPGREPPGAGGPAATVAGYEAWRAGRAALLGRLAHPSVLAPSELALERAGASGPAGTPAPLEEDGSLPSRNGATAAGRAVHGVLQRIDLGGSGELEAIAAALAVEEGCPERAGEIAGLARSALASPVVRAAAASGSAQREVPLVVPLAGGLVDGVVDLLFVEDGRLVVVDYKTDALASPAEVPEAAGRYRLQVGAYALALEAATGLSVARCVLVFLAPPRGAVEHEIAGAELAALAAEAQAHLGARFARSPAREAEAAQ